MCTCVNVKFLGKGELYQLKQYSNFHFVKNLWKTPNCNYFQRKPYGIWRMFSLFGVFSNRHICPEKISYHNSLVTSEYEYSS